VVVIALDAKKRLAADVVAKRRHKLETSNNRAFSEAGIERLFRISDRVMPVIWV